MKKRIEKDLIVDFNPPAKNGLSFDELEKMLLSWQKKLDMADWKIDLKIVDFKKDSGYRQSGHFTANTKKKVATILMTWNPWRGDEEYTLVHEMIHVLLYEFDKFNENKIKVANKNNPKILDSYIEKLEKVVHHLTRAILGRSDR
ncbi:MAG: hypothetical protein A2541_02185 [Candidatus Taylorbacteria bacterium RIFOXYD2_FULL_36_9]|uniref:IrrE N-terminal-like domain-containing protein n=1 Tax=Candidatus Taylorbacteria bacterium RIFOXYD2_FULL_36_9 TaxID=1802338 RepID=A0A1G2PGT4_9BACT|nr:MAG: hypothetical protein A2541_02185 [Candidatus Taylorbacteria bacterium RIFOXYD2_FULL_36_9]